MCSLLRVECHKRLERTTTCAMGLPPWAGPITAASREKRLVCGRSGRLCRFAKISFPSSFHSFQHLAQRGETPGQSGLTPWVSQARGLAHHGAGCLEFEVGWIRHVCSEWYGYALGLGLLLWFRSWLMLCLLDGLQFFTHVRVYPLHSKG